MNIAFPLADFNFVAGADHMSNAHATAMKICGLLLSPQPDAQTETSFNSYDLSRGQNSVA